MSHFANSLPALAQCLADQCGNGHPTEYHAMARNLLAEHRVSLERFSGFAGTLPKNDISGNHLVDAISTHQRNVRPVKTNKAQTAYEHSSNSNNHVALAGDSYLCTVVDLSRHGEAYLEARAQGDNAFNRLGGSGTRTDVNTFLDEAGVATDQAVRGKTLASAFRAMARHARKIHPIWAAEWDSISSYLLPNNPARWVQSVGVAKEGPAWLAVVKYGTPAEVLCRPTQLDAGWYAWHFPSPPHATPETGGFTVDLHPHSPGQTLVREYIHRQIEFSIDNWEGAGGLLAYLDNPAYAELATARERHLETLERHYPGSRSWFDGAP